MIQLKSAREIEVMAAGGKILAATHRLMASELRPGITTWDLDKLAEDFIRSHPGATAAFKGLYGFPGSVCISVNEEIVHGIPSKSRYLHEGDTVSLDFGVQLDGMYTDAAVTLPVGAIDPETQRLLDVTKASLDAGIAAARPGNHLGDIGAAVQGVVEAAGFSVVRDLVGHGVGNALHEDPQVPNYGKPKRGLKLVAGLTLAIEPMVNMGDPGTRTLADKWTIVTIDGRRSAHFEHTVAITAEGPRILTAG
ncbi:MAG TPA: type I methionyl aminopeptidase [Gemmatimonadaceae bacterium]|nr:type I methionyl aminopeptidase [Gemmatimonadaceae bacterium]